MNTKSCTCGTLGDHIIARRKTADGPTVHLWADGALTWGFGLFIKGSPHPRTKAQQEAALKAGWLVLGEVELYDASEVSSLVKAARWVAARDGLPGTFRARVAKILDRV